MIDTGVDGSLTLPPTVIAALQLAWRGRGRTLLADGSESVFDIHAARLAPVVGSTLGSPRPSG